MHCTINLKIIQQIWPKSDPYCSRLKSSTSLRERKELDESRKSENYSEIIEKQAKYRLHRMFLRGCKCVMTLRPGYLLSINHLVTSYEATLFLYLSMFLNILYASTRRPSEPTRAFHHFGLYSLILDQIVKFKVSWITVGGSAK